MITPCTDFEIYRIKNIEKVANRKGHFKNDVIVTSKLKQYDLLSFPDRLLHTCEEFGLYNFKLQ